MRAAEPTALRKATRPVKAAQRCWHSLRRVRRATVRERGDTYQPFAPPVPEQVPVPGNTQYLASYMGMAHLRSDCHRLCCCTSKTIGWSAFRTGARYRNSVSRTLPVRHASRAQGENGGKDVCVGGRIGVERVAVLRSDVYLSASQLDNNRRLRVPCRGSPRRHWRTSSRPSLLTVSVTGDRQGATDLSQGSAS